MNIWPKYVYALSLYGVPVHVLTPYVHIHAGCSAGAPTVTNDKIFLTPPCNFPFCHIQA